MKRFALIFLFSLLASYVGRSQEWMTSFEIAQHLALRQDKLLFMIWEDTAKSEYPLIID